MKDPKSGKPGQPMTPQPPAKDAALPRDVHDRIGSQLRAMYDEFVKQDVPDDLTKLAEEIDRKRNGKG